MKPFGKMLALGAAVLLGASSANAAAVALKLSLVIDVSASIDDNEYALQQEGYASAFRDASIISLIEGVADKGGIAVNVVHFADGASIAYDWIQLTTEAEALDFADDLEVLARSEEGIRTDIASGIDVSAASFADDTFTSNRWVMDVSGDGKQNVPAGAPATWIGLLNDARDAALAGGVDVINGLAITTDFADLVSYYEDNVIGGAGSFVQEATSFDDFDDAILAKLRRELIPQIPEPSRALISLIGLMGALMVRRRK